MTAPDREQLKRDLSDALSAIQQDQGVLGLDELAASLTTLKPASPFHGRLLQKSLAANAAELQRADLESGAGDHQAGREPLGVPVTELLG